MRYSITPKKDTTIYERSGSMNTGIDEILEIDKIVSASDTVNIYNSRALIKFDLTTISSSIVAGIIPSSSEATAPKYYLKLYASQARDLAYKMD